MSDEDDVTGEGRKADPESSDATAADESGVEEQDTTPDDDVTPGGDAGITADMVEAAEADAEADEDAQAASDDDARSEGALVGATAGSARAAARRQAVRTGKTAPKGAATASRKDRPDRGNVFQRLARFFREVVAELRKVIWPTRKEMITYTVVVIVFVVFMVALVAGLDVLFAKGVLAVFS